MHSGKVPGLCDQTIPILAYFDVGSTVQLCHLNWPALLGDYKEQEEEYVLFWPKSIF